MADSVVFMVAVLDESGQVMVRWFGANERGQYEQEAAKANAGARGSFARARAFTRDELDKLPVRFRSSALDKLERVR